MIYLIATICLLLPSYLIRFSVFGVPTTLLEVLIYITVVYELWLIISNKEYKTIVFQRFLGLKKWLWPIGLFLLASIISMSISPDKRAAFGLFKAYIIDPISFFAVVIANVKDKKEIRLIIKALILSGVLVSLHAIWQRVTGQVTFDGRVVGIFGYSPNYLALYLAPIAVLLVGYEDEVLGRVRDLKKVWYWELAFLIILLALLFSGSRAAIGVVVLGSIVFYLAKFWFWIKKSKMNKIVLGFFVTILIFVGWSFTKPDWQANPDSGRISSSNNIRWEIWQTTIKEIIPINTNWLLGIGLGNYQNYFTSITKDKTNYPEWISPNALTPHNIFLNIWLNLGLLGLVSFVWLLILFFNKVGRQTSNTSYILLAAMTTIIIHGLVDTPYWKNDLSVLFWLILALGVINQNAIQKE